MTGLRGAILGAMTALLLLPGAAFAVCDEPASPEGEWPSYGHDLSNSRHQDQGTGIDTTTAQSLKKAFLYRVPGVGAPNARGVINATPIVAGGCVFVESSSSSQIGRIAAIDADTGTQIWAQEVTVGANGFGGPAVSTPALFDNLVISAYDKKAAPFLMAHDRSTGVQVWKSDPIDTQPNSGINASPVVYDGLVFIGFFGNADAGSHERGGFVLLDAATGDVVKKTFVIDDESFAENYEGAGIWSTPAIDTQTGFAYVGTSNPHNPQHEYYRSNSLIKVDLNRDSGDFGEIVASYKGIHDTVVPGAQDQPVCETAPDAHHYAYTFSTTCLAVDVDFGASPNLFRVNGEKRIGGLQKAGIYHIVKASDMTGLSRTPVGPGCFACDAASSAYADGHAYVPGGPPGEMVAVKGSNGVPSWASPIGGGFTYNPAAVSNGVVWTTDGNGFLDGFDQETGAPLVKRNMQDDTEASMRQTTSSAGIAIAHNTLYTALADYVVAYRPDS